MYVESHMQHKCLASQAYPPDAESAPLGFFSWIGRKLSHIQSSCSLFFSETSTKVATAWERACSEIFPAKIPPEKIKRKIVTARDEIADTLDHFNIPEDLINTILSYLQIEESITYSGHEAQTSFSFTGAKTTKKQLVLAPSVTTSLQRVENATPFLRKLTVTDVWSSQDNFNIFRIPCQMAPRLETLELRNCSSIPFFVFFGLGKCTQLKKLFWHNSAFVANQGPNVLVRNQFDYARFAFPTLKELMIETLHEKDLALILKLTPNLENLTLKKWKISEERILEIVKHDKLFSLDLSECVIDNPEVLQSFYSFARKLQSLTLHSGEELKYLGELSQLENLCLSEATDDDLAWISVNCPNLSRLIIKKASPHLKLSADGLLFLKGLDRLTFVSVGVQKQDYYYQSLKFMEVLLPPLTVET